MKLKFIHPEELERNLKATIHKTGKLGFTVEAAKKLALSVEKGMLIAVNEEDATDKNLYVIVKAAKTPDGFRISKAGGYYYVNTKDLFDNLKVDYTNGNIVYDIRDMEIDGQDGYIFKRRDISKTEDKGNNKANNES